MFVLKVDGEGREPKLLHFMGRPDDLSPKARMKMLFGHPAPFDRHDWVVDRGGQEVRYVIDYYHDESGANEDKVPSLTDSSSIKSILVDVRPAIDSFDSFLDRVIRMPFQQINNNTSYNPPPFLPKKDMGTAPPFTKHKEPSQPPTSFKFQKMSTKEINEIIERIESECKPQKDKLTMCNSEETCGAAAVALQRCSALILCPTVVKEFDDVVAKVREKKELGDDGAAQEELSKSFDTMTTCMESFALACYNAGGEPRNGSK